MKKTHILFLLFINLTITLFGQVVITDGSNNAPVSTNSMLEVRAQNHDKGVLFTRVTTTQRMAMTPDPAHDNGLLVYDTDTQSFWYYTTKWEKIDNSENVWKVMGNAGTDSVINFFGTTDSQPVRLGTNGQERIRLGSNGGVKVNGYFEADSAKINGPLIVSSDSGSFGFFGNTLFPCSPGLTTDLMKVTTKYFTIKGATNTWATAPLKGMGVNWQCPITGNMLDVYDGAVNVFSPSNFAVGYKIGNQYVLRHKGNSSNIFAGVNAGLNLAGTSGNDNTIMGFDAVSVNSIIGGQNTIMGSGAGKNLTAPPGANDNTFMGFQSGFNATNGKECTFLGSLTGFSETTGGEHVYIGLKSGFNSNKSFHNTFVGSYSGFNTTSGSSNTFLGYTSGLSNSTGQNNVAVGFGSGPFSSNLQNSIAIGTNSLVTNSNQMILGDNNVNVGIGLSADPFGPLNKLEISTGIANTSGLKFRDLNSLSPTNPTPTGVLSLDVNGNVIYVAAPSGGGVNICTVPGPLTDNVTKFTTGNSICRTNITDLFPSFPYVGINTTTPINALDVDLGDINVVSPLNAYKLGNKAILWHKGNTSDLYVGVNAGMNTASGNNNTIMGFSAASVATALGDKNTIVGSEAAFNFNAGGFGSTHNTIMGYQAGYNYAFGGNNSTFIGSQAGFNEGSDEDVYVGWHAGFNSTGSLHCVFIGNGAGGATTGGYQCVFIGIGSGTANQTGSNNVALGGGSGPGLPNIQNAIAIGDAASVMGSNHMILGNNNVNVGIGLSGNALGPQNKLEISTGSPNTSGLKFRNLNSLSPTNPTPPGVLSLDANGNVIYVTAPTTSGGSLGNICTLPQNPLTASYEIPLNTFDFNFSGDGTNNNKVNIGFPCGSSPLPGKLNVTTAFQSDPVSASGDSYSIYATDTHSSLFSNNTGVYGEATSTGTGTHETGVWGVANGDRQAIGVHGQAGSVSTFGPAFGGYFESVTAGNIINYGVQASAGNANDNIGVYSVASGGINNNFGVYSPTYGGANTTGGYFQAFGGTTTNIGVSGMAYPTTFISNPPTVPTGINVGVYGNAPWNASSPPWDYAGFFDGDVWINGPLSGTGIVITSDQMFKTNVDTIDNALDIIKQLKPKTFYYDKANKYGMHFSDKKQYGVIAQDVEKVLPELVIDNKKPAMVDSAGKIITEGVSFKSVNYEAFTGILIRAVQQLQSQNEKQDSLIRLLTAALNVKLNKPDGSVNSNDKMINQSDVTLTDEDVIVLNQNVPNPFAEQTSITYNIPGRIGVARILFYNDKGQIIKVVDINTRGEGKLKVYSNDLSTGMYSYSLVADGKVVETKKMMKQQ
ncbi:MAG: tail fiber domain-containing protein [Bacteroidetes bacterium]|nr:tail fiber domain-containing protein [Bacteroidota bacterium]